VDQLEAILGRTPLEALGVEVAVWDAGYDSRWSSFAGARLDGLRALSVAVDLSDTYRPDPAATAAQVLAMVLGQNLAGLQRLELGDPDLGRGVQLDAELLGRLVASPLAGQLVDLRLHSSAVDNARLKQLATAPGLGRLETLVVRGSPITTVRMLADTGGLPRLRRLFVDTRWISIDEHVHLLQARPGLVGLTISPRRTGRHAFDPLLARDEARRLEELRLVSAGIGFLPALLDALPRLRALALSNIPISVHDARLLANGPRLRRLAFTACQLSDDAIRVLCDSEQLGELDRLDLHGNGMSDETKTLVRARFGAAARL
jgi:hypothetical protein